MVRFGDEDVDGSVVGKQTAALGACLLSSSDAADDPLSLDLGGRRLLK